MNEIKTTPTKLDFERTVAYAAQSQSKAMMVWAVLLVVTGCGSTVATVLSGPAAGVLVAIVASLALMANRKRSIAKMYSKPGVLRRMNDPCTFTFTPEGLNAEFTSGVQTYVPWSTISKIERNGQQTVVFTNELSFYLVPDYCFASETDRQQALAMASAGTRSMPLT